MDKFQDDPIGSSLLLSVYAEPGIAKKPLNCPIEITGIDPETTVYIIRPPPPPAPSSNS